MNEFSYHGEMLYCEEVPVAEVARETGTPYYLYSRRAFEQHFTAFDNAFAGVPHLTCYSVKSNSNIAVLRLLARRGAGFDVVSGGEIYRALQAGADPRKIVYSGVGKTRSEIAYALQNNILMFNVESAQELDLINAVAQEFDRRAGIALRINPDVDPQTHPYISTGMRKNKFGIHIDTALTEYRRAAAMSHVDILGVDCHIGSQITDVSPFRDTVARVRAFIERLSAEGVAPQYIDLGGGLGIAYNDEQPPPPEVYAEAIVGGSDGLDCTLIFGPGRSIAGNAGILVTRVQYVKQSGDKNFIIVDAAMNDLVRPSLYDAYHEIRAVQRTDCVLTADIVGPICETGDFMARGREVPDVAPGQLLAVMSAGAYGFTMASNYNSRPRVPEVLVDGTRFDVVRARETYEDLIRGERIPDHLRG